MTTTTKMLLVLVLVIGGGLGAMLLNKPESATAAQRSAGSLTALLPADTGWTVGELRPNGLRIVPSGSADASTVLDPARFTGSARHAYQIATEIPEVLNQLYCWCGCENRGVHRSNLQCFEDGMGENCAVCQGTAEIASEMTRQGVTDAGKIQAAVDAKWGRES